MPSYEGHLFSSSLYFLSFLPRFWRCVGACVAQKCPKCPKCPKNEYRRSSGTTFCWDTPSEIWDTLVSQKRPVDIAKAKRTLSDFAPRRVYAGQSDLFEHMCAGVERLQLRFA